MKYRLSLYDLFAIQNSRTEKILKIFIYVCSGMSIKRQEG